MDITLKMLLGTDADSFIDSLEYGLVLEELANMFPLTLHLAAAFSPVRVHGKPAVGCAVCKLFHGLEVPGVQEFIAPPNVEDSMELALRRYSDMGDAIPSYIKDLFKYDQPDLQQKAVAQLGCGENKSDDWLIFQGLAVMKELSCHHPEHEMEFMATTHSPDTKM